VSAVSTPLYTYIYIYICIYESCYCSAGINIFSSFCGFEQQGVTSADLVHGNRKGSLHSVADRMFILPKQGRSLRSEIIIYNNNNNNNGNNLRYSSVDMYMS
jgi:hypothetical protein